MKLLRVGQKGKENPAILDKNGKIVRNSESLDSLIRKVEWTKLKIVR